MSLARTQRPQLSIPALARNIEAVADPAREEGGQEFLRGPESSYEHHIR